MPKNTEGKNTKGKSKTTKATNQPKTVKKAPVKKAETKKEVKKGNKPAVKKVETKKEVNKPVVKKERKKIFSNLNIPMSNLFIIACCIIVLLVGLLIYMFSIKVIPTLTNSKTIATIDGKKFTTNDLYQELKDTYGTDALINLIDTYIANKEVKITKEDKDYVQEVVDYYKEYAEYYKTDLATFLSNYMGLSGITTEEEFYDYVLEDYKKTLAIEKFISNEASEEVLKEYYKENYSDKLTVKHILIEVDSEAEDQEKADKEAYDKAVSLIKELNETKESKLDSKFEELAKNNSDDTGTYAEGGLIEDFTKKDVLTEFWDAAYKLKDGKYTKEPVKTSYGYHIILKVSSEPVEKYNDIKDDVKKSYAESLLSSDSTLKITKWDELRKKYNLSLKDSTIKSTYKNTIKEATSTNNSNDSDNSEETETED